MSTHTHFREVITAQLELGLFRCCVVTGKPILPALGAANAALIYSVLQSTAYTPVPRSPKLMAPRSRRALVSATIFLATCGVLGSVISQRVAAQSASDESTLRDSLKSFTSVYSVVEQNYAEKMDADRTDKAIYDGAIPGMLHVLDPHSNFYDPKAYAQMREDQHGRYYGVGMTISPQLVDGTMKIYVLYPFEGTPSYKAGIRPGDLILSVDGKPDGRNGFAQLSPQC